MQNTVDVLHVAEKYFQYVWLMEYGHIFGSQEEIVAGRYACWSPLWICFLKGIIEDSRKSPAATMDGVLGGGRGPAIGPRDAY